MYVYEGEKLILRELTGSAFDLFKFIKVVGPFVRF